MKTPATETIREYVRDRYGALAEQAGAGEAAGCGCQATGCCADTPSDATYSALLGYSADDLAQETLLKVFRSRATLRDDTKLEAWLYQVARGTLIDHYRRQRPAEELPAALAGESPDEMAALRARVMVSIKKFLEELPAAYREPVRLAELEGLPLAHIALRLDLSLTAVKSRVRRGRAMLRNKLQDCGRFEFDRLGQVIGFERRQLLCCGN